MLEMILSAREDEEEFDKIPHHYNRNITKGFYDRDIVAHIAHFFLEGILNSYIFFTLYARSPDLYKCYKGKTAITGFIKC